MIGIEVKGKDDPKVRIVFEFENGIGGYAINVEIDAAARIGCEETLSWRSHAETVDGGDCANGLNCH